MSPKVKQRGEAIRKFILENVEKHPNDIAPVAAAHFGISRQGAHRHVQNLVRAGALRESGKTKARVYALLPEVEWWGRYDIEPDLDEDKVWRADVLPLLESLPANVRDIWHYAFTEMFNNAVDHSEGKQIGVLVARDPTKTRMSISDDGIGIFRKICERFGLEDQRHAVLELAKGKLTTDPSRHTGEGIFFTSRMVDDFGILAGDIYFSHLHPAPEDWILERTESDGLGTQVSMSLSNHTAREQKAVFDKFASPEDNDFGFTKTVVPVRLARYGADQLVSRSQAKRMLARVDRFRTVILDFTGVEQIGQAFADEAFRVFANAHPEVELVAMHAAPAVTQMINRARYPELPS